MSSSTENDRKPPEQETGQQDNAPRFRVLPRNPMTFALRLLIIYVIVVLVVYLIQYRLLYFPTRMSLEQVAQAAKGLGLEPWPQPIAEHRGFMAKQAAKPKSLGMVVICHGNAGSALDRLYYVHALNRLGLDVFLAEYPGYGARPGKLGERNFVPDIRQAIRLLQKEGHKPIYVWGESLGCGVTAAVAADKELDIAGLILLSPWDSLPHIAQRQYWFLPAKWLTTDQYDSVANLKDFTKSVAVLKAEEDELVPNDLSMRLYSSLTCPKKLWTFPASGHNTWPAEPGLPWWKEVMDFVGSPDAVQPAGAEQ